MTLNEFKQINTIIERDSKDATYKFALLRSVIEVIHEYSHFKKESGYKVTFPLGLLIEKWLLYYYPLIDSPIFLPQKNGETPELVEGKKIAFRKQFKIITDYYSGKGGFSVFYRDFKAGSLPHAITPAFIDLIKSLKDTITIMPMRYLGNAVFSRDYSVFRFNKDHKKIHRTDYVVDLTFLINNFGTFSFDKNVFTVLEYIGGFITGVDSILFKWAEFTAKADRSGALTIDKVLSQMQIFPETERDVYDAKNLYKKLFKQDQRLECVWSKKTIKQISSLNIDHVIPFTIWKNNDLWNLLPVHKDIHPKKKARVPSLKQLGRSRDAIIYYWEKLRGQYEKKFDRERHLTLLSEDISINNWKSECFEKLKEKCRYLIDIRGFEKWNL